jgi:hypothetical protein
MSEETCLCIKEFELHVENIDRQIINLLDKRRAINIEYEVLQEVKKNLLVSIDDLKEKMEEQS